MKRKLKDMTLQELNSMLKQRQLSKTLSEQNSLNETL